MMGVFIPWKLANTKYQTFYCFVDFQDLSDEENVTAVKSISCVQLYIINSAKKTEGKHILPCINTGKLSSDWAKNSLTLLMNK